MLRNLKQVSALLLVTALAACGGGGSGGAADATPPTLNLQAAWKNLRQQNGSAPYTISGSINGVSVSGTGELISNYNASTSFVAINPAAPFPGPSLQLNNLSRTLNQFSSRIITGGNATIVNSSENWYYDTNDNLKVLWNVEDLEQTIITSFTPLPAQVTAGSTGAFYNGTIYSRLGYTCGTTSATYSVSARSATSLTVTFIVTESTTWQTVGQCTTGTYSSRYEYELSSVGLRIRSVIGSGGGATGSLTFTF
jgi:hypothetical protein